MTEKFTPELWLTATIAEQYAGSEEITAPAARFVLAQAGFNDASHSGTHVLDIGAGLGQVTEAVMEKHKGADIHITAGDIKDALLDSIRAKVGNKGWEGKVEAKMMDVMSLPFPDNHFDYAIGGLLYNLIPKPVEALTGFTTWAHSGPMYLLQEAQSLLPAFPNTRTVESANRTYATGYWHDPRFVRETLEKLGMEDIKVETVPYVHEAESAAAMAKTMWPVVGMVSMMGMGGPGEKARVEGWKMFGKIEEVLKMQFGEGPVRVTTVALVATAKKPE